MPINIFTTFDDPSATRAQPLRVPARSERIHRGLFVAATLRDAGSHLTGSWPTPKTIGIAWPWQTISCAVAWL